MSLFLLCLLSLLWQPALSVRSLVASNVAELTTVSSEDSSSLAELQKQLITCNNEKYLYSRINWEAAVATDRPNPPLKIVGTWWTEAKPRIPVTLVTQLTMSRLPQLIAACKAWRGPLSAAILLDMVHPADALSETKLQEIKQAVDSLNRVDMAIRLGGEEVCQLDMMLTFEVYTDSHTAMMYPINTLRNLARLQARTPLLAMFDADLLPSHSFYLKMLDKDKAQLMMDTAKQRFAYIVPAFETAVNSTDADAFAADLLVQKPKKDFVEAIQAGAGFPFGFAEWPQGHNVTNFPKWYQATEQYEVKYQDRMEPWVVVDRFLAPWHDSRFRGYGGNKLIHLAALNASNFKFMVDPDSFLIHRAHAKSASSVAHRQDVATGWKLINQVEDENLAERKKNLYLHSTYLYRLVKKDFDSGVVKPMLEVSTLNCLQKLSWWSSGQTPTR